MRNANESQGPQCSGREFAVHDVKWSSRLLRRTSVRLQSDPRIAIRHSRSPWRRVPGGCPRGFEQHHVAAPSPPGRRARRRRRRGTGSTRSSAMPTSLADAGDATALLADAHQQIKRAGGGELADLLVQLRRRSAPSSRMSPTIAIRRPRVGSDCSVSSAAFIEAGLAL